MLYKYIFSLNKQSACEIFTISCYQIQCLKVKGTCLSHPPTGDNTRTGPPAGTEGLRPERYFLTWCRNTDGGEQTVTDTRSVRVPHTYTHMHILVCPYTYVRTHIHTRTHIHLCIHTRGVALTEARGSCWEPPVAPGPQPCPPLDTLWGAEELTLKTLPCCSLGTLSGCRDPTISLSTLLKVEPFSNFK